MAKCDVVLDNTHLNLRDRNAVHELAKEFGNCTVIENVFQVPVEECLRRNALREGSARAPYDVILRMASKASINPDGKIPGVFNRLVLY